MFVSILGKLSEIHLHAWFFSNPYGKVLIIVGISWSPDLRVQHIYIFLSPLNAPCNASTTQLMLRWTLKKIKRQII